MAVKKTEKKISKEKKRVAPPVKEIKEKKEEVSTEEAAVPKEEAKAEAPGAAIPEKPEPPSPKRAKPQKKAPKKVKAFVARGKRKEAIARASIRAGKGRVRVNRVLLSSYANKYVREIIREPLRYMGPEAGSVDISVNVIGGGAMGQAQAARTAIANALIQYFDEIDLKERFISIDRSLVIEDTRRVEPKKYRGPKARARYQKSYR